jgi:hypothetical protein
VEGACREHEPAQTALVGQVLVGTVHPLHRLEALQGDLYDLFHKRLAEDGPRRARLLFARDVLHMMRPRTNPAATLKND